MRRIAADHFTLAVCISLNVFASCPFTCLLMLLFLSCSSVLLTFFNHLYSTIGHKKLFWSAFSSTLNLGYFLCQECKDHLFLYPSFYWIQVVACSFPFYRSDGDFTATLSNHILIPFGSETIIWGPKWVSGNLSSQAPKLHIVTHTLWEQWWD